MQTKIINVMDANMVTARDEQSGTVYVALKPIVEAMGIDWSRQREKISNDQRYRHMSIPFETAGGVQDMICIDHDHLPAFLYSINANKVRKDLRKKVMAFQSETFAVINAYWRENPKHVDDAHVSDIKEESLIGVVLRLVENQQKQTEAIFELIGEMRSEHHGRGSAKTLHQNIQLTPAHRKAVKAAIEDRADVIATSQGLMQSAIAPAIWIAFKSYFLFDHYADLPDASYAEILSWVASYEPRKSIPMPEV